MEQYVFKNQKQLRCGITTGTCAAAASAAAAALLLNGLRRQEVQVHTPKGITVSVPVFLTGETADRVEYMVIKDSGDDPDVTNHAKIYVSVEKLKGQDSAENGEKRQQESVPSACENRKEEKREPADCCFRDERYPNLYLDGGEGIGRITKEGLEQRIGQAAINTVPRSMIFQAVGEACSLAEYTQPLLITVSIPEGKELAARTFNPRLGIEGGLSVLGTSGILEPMSEKAIVDTIETEIRQLYAQGVKQLLVTPGNYGQSYAERYLGLELDQSIKCSNYIGDTLDLAVSYGMEAVLLVGNIGKLVKLAAGIMNTHSRVADGRCEIMAVHAAMCGADAEQVRKLMKAVNTEQMLDDLTQWKLKNAVINGICERIQEYLVHRTGKSLKAAVILFSEKYGYLGQTLYAEELLADFRRKH